MKMRKPHDKPLPSAAVTILRDLQALRRNSPLVFASDLSPGEPISENTLNDALKRMGYDGTRQTAHGFRSTASSLLNESGLWNADAIETELAHLPAGSIRAVYNRTPYWDERVRMANWWSERVTGWANDLPTAF